MSSDSMAEKPLPYWLANVPEDQWPSECPDFLANVDDIDKRNLSVLDADYHVQTWADVQEIIKTNRLDLFQRVPSDLRRYLGFNAKLRKKYGSVMNFLINERLHWTDLTAAGDKPFENPDDIKILRNDWPYGIDKKIVHLVVWTKFDLEDDPATDDLTPQARKQIADYVKRSFSSRVPPEHVVWFKNWKSLKSVRAVEHFHVMMYDPDPSVIAEITGGDIAMSDKVA